MITLYAQPYDMDSNGFYFDSIDDYENKREALRNRYGQPVEEFKIQYIEGDEVIDCELATAWGLNQENINGYFAAVDDLDDHDKTKIIIAVGEGGYSLNNEGSFDADSIDLDVYQVENMQELAEQFVDEGLFGDIPEHLENYIDIHKIARDLEYAYAMTTVSGERLAYRLG